MLTLDTLTVVLAQRQVVREVSGSFPAGNLVALVGPNGAGKTTLLKAICGVAAFAGRVSIAGRPIEQMEPNERARLIGYLPQGHAMHWPLPVRDIVALGRYPHGGRDPSRLNAAHMGAIKTAMEAADIVHLAGRPVTELSGGERSRVALARVLAVQSPIVLADEPVAALDPRHQLDVMTLLRRMADNGILVLAVTHDLGLAVRFADRVLVMADGALVVDGAPDKALSDDILSQVFGIAAVRFDEKGRSILVPWTTHSRPTAAT